MKNGDVISNARCPVCDRNVREVVRCKGMRGEGPMWECRRCETKRLLSVVPCNPAIPRE
jgi:hypothetical protein